MFNYPVSAAILGTGMNMFVLAAILILSWYRFFASPMTSLEDDDYRDPFESQSSFEPSEIGSFGEERVENLVKIREDEDEEYENLGSLKDD